MLNQTVAIEIAIPLLKRLEGFRAVAYPDNGAFSYGFGHRGAREGSRISRADAETLLLEDVTEISTEIMKKLPDWLNPNQFAALISFSYNVGAPSLFRSTLLDRIHEFPAPSADQLKEIGDQFLRWIYTAGEANSALCTRRTRERALYMAPYVSMPSADKTDSSADGTSMKG